MSCFRSWICFFVIKRFLVLINCYLRLGKFKKSSRDTVCFIKHLCIDKRYLSPTPIPSCGSMHKNTKLLLAPHLLYPFFFLGVKNPIETSFTKISHGNHIRTIKVGKHSDRIPLVLLHGFAGGLGFWTLNLDSLSQKQNVYAIDILGFGRSSRPTFSADPSEAEAVFTKSLEEWRIEIGLEDFILVGHSFGGYLAAAYTLSHPKRVEHLILVDPWGFPEVPEPGDEPIQIPGFVKLLVNAITSFNLLAVIRAAGPLGML